MPCRFLWFKGCNFDSHLPTTENAGHGSGFFEDAFVVALVGGDDVVGAVVFLGVDAGEKRGPSTA